MEDFDIFLWFERIFSHFNDRPKKSRIFKIKKKTRFIKKMIKNYQKFLSFFRIRDIFMQFNFKLHLRLLKLSVISCTKTHTKYNTSAQLEPQQSRADRWRCFWRLLHELKGLASFAQWNFHLKSTAFRETEESWGDFSRLEQDFWARCWHVSIAHKTS